MSQFLNKGVIPVYSYSPEMQINEESREFLPLLFKAIADRKKIWITYHNPWGEEKSYTVNPISLFKQNGTLYLYSYNDYFENSMVHAFSRIKEISIADDAIIPEEFRDMKHIIDPFGIAIDDDYTGVIVWIDPEQAFFEKESLKNEKAEITDNEDGSIIIKIKTRNRYACKRWILGLGSQAKCLGPDDLVEEIKQDILNTSSQYNL